MIPPRTAAALLSWLGAFFLFVGIYTTTYPPTYFAYPLVQGVATILAGAAGIWYSCTCRIRWPKWTAERWGILIGAGYIGVMFSRGLAILIELGWEADDVLAGEATDPRDTSLLIAGIQWWTLGWCVAILWPHLMRAIELPHAREDHRKEHDDP